MLLSMTRLRAVAEHVMRAQPGASGWQDFWGAPLESRGGGDLGCAGRGGGDLCAPGHTREIGPPPQRGAPERGRLPRPAALQPLVPCPAGPGAGIGVPIYPGGLRSILIASPQPCLLGRVHTTFGAPWGGPRLVGGNLNFDLKHLLQPPPSVLASLLVRRPVHADLELASAFGRDPFCSY